MLLRRLLPAALALTLVLAVTHAPAAGASSTQDAIFQDDGQLRADIPGTLQTLSELGVSRLRVALTWSTVAPRSSSRRRPAQFSASDPASYPAAGWAFYDQVVQQAHAHGISVYLVLTGPAPLWATGSDAPSGGPYGQWKPAAREFGSFVRAAGTRYSGSYRPSGSASALPRVSFWSIWNEPNYGIDLAPQATAGDTIELSAAAYRRLLDAAWSSLRASHHGADTILIGETAPRGLDHPIGNFSGVKPLRFLRALYCVDASYRPLQGSAAVARGCPATAAGSRRFRSQNPGLFSATGFADHPYEQGVPPNKPTYACGRTTCTNRSGQSDPDYADLPEIDRLESVLDRLQRIYGSHTRFPIFSTEYGFWTNPPDRSARISPTTAARYMNWAEYLSWRASRLRSYSQYLLVDPPLGNFASGLEFTAGAPKVTFDAYRMPLFLPISAGRRGHALEVWGAVRPAHLATGPEQVRVQLQPRSHGSFQTVSTVPISNLRGYFDVGVTFPASGSVRLAWSQPSGATIHSRTVAITVR